MKKLNDHTQQQHEQAQREENTRLFKTHMHGVRPLRSNNRAVHAPPQPFPEIRRQPPSNNNAMFYRNLSDELDIEHLLETDDLGSYRNNGVSLDTLKRLRRGHWVTQTHIDLHGLNTEQARQAVARLVASCIENNIRCARIIHGKGLSSQSQEPILKNKVKRWLVQINEVLAFCQAPPQDGGAGALLLLLKTK